MIPPNGNLLPLPHTNHKGYDGSKMDDMDGSNTEDSSLEVPETGPGQSIAPSLDTPEVVSTEPRGPKFMRSRGPLLIAGLIFVIIIGSVIIALAAKKPAKQPSTTIVVNTQSLDNGTLNKLTAKTGDSSSPVQQQLTISPDTLFKNNVEIQKNLDVKGISVFGGGVTIGNGLTIHGGLSIGGNSTLGGNLSVNGLLTAASLSVGSISNNTINLSGDLNLGGHLIPSGISPSIKASVAASGGTAIISGNDISGTVTINTGGGQLIAGEMAIVTFHKPFGLTPKIQLTPVNASGANLRYFVSQSPTFFTIQTASAPANGAQYEFNYFVTQ